MCRGEEAAATRAARTIPLGGGGRGFQEIQTLRQEIGILTKHSRPAAAPRRGAPASLNPRPAGTQAGDPGSGTRLGGPRTPASERGRGRRPPPSAPLPLPPVFSLPGGGSGGIGPDKTLALGVAFPRPPTDRGKGPWPLSPLILQKMNLQSPSRFPYFQ